MSGDKPRWGDVVRYCNEVHWLTLHHLMAMERAAEAQEDGNEVEAMTWLVEATALGLLLGWSVKRHIEQEVDQTTRRGYFTPDPVGGALPSQVVEYPVMADMLAGEQWTDPAKCKQVAQRMVALAEKMVADLAPDAAKPPPEGRGSVGRP